MTILEEFTKTKHWIIHHHPHVAKEPILKVSSVNVVYDGWNALENINFELQAGERMAVVGPNGAGKSTLFKVIAGLLAPSQGKIHIYGHEPGGHICIAYVPQRSLVDWKFPVTVADVAMMGRIGKIGFFHNPRKKDWDIVKQSLEIVGMDHLYNRQINQLSGGQQQRMFIAQALSQEAELMLMDEPLSGLDATSQEDIFNILDILKQKNVTIMVAMHDLNLAAERFERVMLLNHRLLGIGAPQEVIQPAVLMEAYGDRLHMLKTKDGTIAFDDTCCDEGNI